MNTIQSSFGMLALGALGLCAVQKATGETPAKPSPLPVKTALIATSELAWTPLPGIEGAQQARLVGDVSKEAHRAFFRYPVGLASPLHAHTHGDRGVIVSGMLSLAIDGAPAKKLAPGSFFSIAAGTPHITRVEGEEPCVFYMEREGPFDVVPVDPAKPKAR